jgi:hypothetical protein
MWLRRIALIAISIALVTPILATASPPLSDYPDHSTGFALLVQLLPLAVASKTHLALALLLPLLGTVALHDAIFEKRSWWPLASAVVVYNTALLAGFVNFAIGIGLALLGAACWVRLRHRPQQQVTAGAAIAAAIFFINTFGAGFLVLLIASFELREIRLAPSRTPLAPRAAKLALTALPVTILDIAMWLTHSPTSPAIAFAKEWSWLSSVDLFNEAIGAAASFFTYDTGADLLILIAVAAALAALALAHKLAFAWPAIIAAALMLAYPFVPGLLAEGSWIDIRLPVLAAFLLFAGITPRRLGRRETAVLGLAFAALIVARLGVITLAWQGQNADLAEITAATTPIAAQDRAPVSKPTAAAAPVRVTVRLN